MRRLPAIALAACVVIGVCAPQAPFAIGQPAQPAQPGQQPTMPIPLHPTNPAVSEAWVNPAVRPGEGEKAQITLVDAPRALNPNEPVTVTLLVTNTSGERLDGLTVTPRRGPATGSVVDQRIATVASPLDYEVVGPQVGVDTQLQPGESTELELAFSQAVLPLPGVSTYPLMFVLSAASGELLDTERFHLSIRGTPDGVQPAGMSALFPISAPVDIVPGETGTAPGEPPLILASEQLADQLAPGGRLSSLLDVYTNATANPSVAGATCLAVDPAVIHTVARMAEGYTVAGERPDLVEPPQRLRDSWGGSDKETEGEPGRGAGDAQAWLERMRELAAARCIIALPWANSDLNAVARTGDVWLMREAVERGPATITEALGTAGVTNAVVTPAGYLVPGVPAALGWADHSRSTIATEGMQGAWERAQSGDAIQGSGPVGADALPSLDRGDVPAIAAAAAPEPVRTVRVLVSDNTVERADATNRFAWVSPGVMAVTFQDSLATVLASVDEHPAITGYSAPGLRFNYTQDSAKARSVNAAGAVHLAAQSAWTSPEQPEAQPVLVNPPATWDAAAATDIMGAVADVFDTQAARPLSFEDYLAVPDGEDVPAAGSVGTPYVDPTVFSNTEILTASQQGRFIDELSSLLVADPAIALSRYGFTLPLRRDLLTALTMSGRRSYTFYPVAEEATRQRLAGSRDTLNALRSAIALIPPGNVYTRTSPSSPLVIVARNGLPLPVDTTIRYHGADGARLNVPTTLRIPAYGSLTVSMTADLPANNGETDLRLFLASPQGAQISEPVDITVRTSGVALRGGVILAALAGALALMLLITVGRRRAARRKHPPPHRPPHNHRP